MKKLIALVLCSLAIGLQAKVLIISDIDDTIKKANSMGSVSVVWYFLKADPYVEMAGIYRELEDFYLAQGEEVEFIYLSAAYDATFAQEKWLKKYNFPMGKTILRKLGDGRTYEYKYRNLDKILKAQDLDNLELFLFGDNSDQDPKVYRDITNDLKIKSPQIYIRDVSTFATYWQAGWEIKRLSGIEYFFSEMELRNSPFFYFLSNPLTKLIETQYQKQDLIPAYTFETLKQRIERHECLFEGILNCDKDADKWAESLWLDYHQRL